MRIGSLFSGIGGLELGLERGLRATGIDAHTIYQVERSAFCRYILARHWPNAVRYDDVCSVGAAVLPVVDLLCGGFPCQDVSAAGLGAGIGTEAAPTGRSGLWWQFARIIEETRPRWVVVENVASGARRWLPAVRRALGARGYDSLPVGIAACEVGARHRRERVFVVARLAHAGCLGWRRPGVIDEHEGQSDTEGGTTADPHDQGQPQSQGGLPELGRWVGDGAAQDPGKIVPWSGLSARPWMVRGVHGLPGGVDGPWKRAGWTPARLREARIRALGNAVVPAQVEPIGFMIGRALLAIQ